MKQAYTPGLEVTKRTTVTKTRELPMPGQTLVRVGDFVHSEQAVLSAELPGELDIVRIADQLGFDVVDVLPGLRKAVGDQVSQGEILCEVKSFFGFFTSSVKSPSAGVVEFFTPANGHMGIRRPSEPLAISAYLSGNVKEVVDGRSVTIESTAALLQGIFGVGGERVGVVQPLPVEDSAVVTAAILESMRESLSGKVLIGGSSFETDALHVAARAGVQGVVTGSILAETLREFVGHEIGVSITGDETVPFSLIITEGFGSLPISSRVMAWAKALSGQKAVLSGATQVRAGALRPEVIVSFAKPSEKVDVTKENPLVLDDGSAVRIIRVPYFGQFGTIDSLPHEPEEIESGAVMRVVRVRLTTGAVVTVPRANIELV